MQIWDTSPRGSRRKQSHNVWPTPLTVTLYTSNNICHGQSAVLSVLWKRLKKTIITPTAHSWHHKWAHCLHNNINIRKHMQIQQDQKIYWKQFENLQTDELVHKRTATRTDEGQRYDFKSSSSSDIVVSILQKPKKGTKFNPPPILKKRHQNQRSLTFTTIFCLCDRMPPVIGRDL